VPIIDCP